MSPGSTNEIAESKSLGTERRPADVGSTAEPVAVLARLGIEVEPPWSDGVDSLGLLYPAGVGVESTPNPMASAPAGPHGWPS